MPSSLLENLRSMVRAMAEKLNLTTAQKKDSQGLCFIGESALPDFLQQKLAKKEGEVIEMQEIMPCSPKIGVYTPYEFEKMTSEVVGKHIGAHFYTIGQRRGLGIGGYETPLFVAFDVRRISFLWARRRSSWT